MSTMVMQAFLVVPGIACGVFMVVEALGGSRRGGER